MFLISLTQKDLILTYRRAPHPNCWTSVLAAAPSHVASNSGSNSTRRSDATAHAESPLDYAGRTPSLQSLSPLFNPLTKELPGECRGEIWEHGTGPYTMSLCGGEPICNISCQSFTLIGLASTTVALD